MIEGYSLRKCAEQLNDEVTHVTLFYWRHKILAALKQVPTEAFQGIVEMDGTYFLYSEKGKRNINERKPRKRGGKAKYRGISKDQVCVLVFRDRQKMTFSGVLGRGSIQTLILDEAIGGHLSDSNVLCTDAWRAFSSYANAKGLAHYRFKSDRKQRVKGVYHIQNVNSYHSRLKRWMDRFNGVATKYLQHFGLVPLHRQQGIRDYGFEQEKYVGQIMPVCGNRHERQTSAFCLYLLNGQDCSMVPLNTLHCKGYSY